MTEEQTTEIVHDDDLPGVPLSSGFDYRPSGDVPEAILPDEARARINQFLENWKKSRLFNCA